MFIFLVNMMLLFMYEYLEERKIGLMYLLMRKKSVSVISQLLLGEVRLRARNLSHLSGNFVYVYMYFKLCQQKNEPQRCALGLV